jgi:hypothetical protein
MDQRHLIGAPIRDMAVQRIVAGVDHRACEPAAIEADAGIEDFFRRLDPVDLPRRLAPKTLGIGKRARMDFVVAAVVLDVQDVSPGTPLSRDGRAIQVPSFRGASKASEPGIQTHGTLVLDSGSACFARIPE